MGYHFAMCGTGRKQNAGASWVSALAIAAAAMLSPQAVFAQDAAPGLDTNDAAADDGSADTLQDIVVTAQRRNEKLQETPIMITALSADSLAESSVRDLNDLSGRVPGLVIGGKSTGASAVPLTLRGISGQAVVTGADSAVSVYLDGVYLSKLEGSLFALADVERLEVLKGPQGTLYGRNATAGAINIITRTPDSDEWHGDLSASYGNFNSYELKGYAGGPLGHGFSGSVSAVATRHDGYMRNVVGNKPLNDLDALTWRVKLRYENDSGNFDATASYDRTRTDSNFAVFFFGYGPTPATFNFVGVSDPGHNYAEYTDYNYNSSRSQGASLTLNFRPSPELTLTSISGWRDLKVGGRYSATQIGGLPLIAPNSIVSVNNTHYGPSLSQELRAVYSGDSINLTAGATFFSEKVFSHYGGVVQNPTLPPVDINTVAGAPIVQTDTKSYAAFAQMDWKLTDQLTVTGGLRLNHEDRSMDERWPSFTPNRTLASQVKETKLIFKGGLSYRPTNDLMLFATVSEGYQAPAQSFSSLAPPTGVILEVPSEKLISYEGGFKSEWFDGKFRFNATYFHYDYNPLQVRVTTGLNQFNIMGAKAKVDGAEFEGAIVLTRGLVLSGNLVYLNSRYTDFCDTPLPSPVDSAPNCLLVGTTGANNGVSRVGKRLNQAPKFQGNLSLAFDHELANGWKLALNSSLSFQSEYFSAPSNARPYLRSEPLTRLDLRAGLTLPSGVELFAYGRNVNNDQTATTMIFTPFVGTYWNAGGITDPRTYGAGVRYKF